jgi:hydrogenase nickel incorporation protein HypB
MDSFKVIEIKASVFEDNNRQADTIRADLKQSKTFLLNLMSSPGSGKTTTVVRTIEALKDELKIGVVEADVDSDVDAVTVSRTGARVVQLHTGGMCHMDASMTRQGLSTLDTQGLDLVILENIGNLLCPAEFDTGAVKNVMILSVPEGDDKPLKYPLMFSKVDVLLVNKIDTLPMFDFDLQAVRERVTRLNSTIRIIPISAKTGQGVEEWADWLREAVAQWKND